jgi:hypothetical protein
MQESSVDLSPRYVIHSVSPMQTARLVRAVWVGRRYLGGAHSACISLNDNGAPSPCT